MAEIILMSTKRKILVAFVLATSGLVSATNFATLSANAKHGSEPQERKLRPGDRVNVSNRFDFGSVSITGWDGETVRAVATSEDGTVSVPVSITNDPSDGRRILVATGPAQRRRAAGRIHLDVKVPHTTELEPVYVPKAEAKVTDISGAVDIRSDSGTIIVSHVGSVKARADSGEIQVNEVRGLVSVRTSSANVVVTRVEGDVAADAGSANLRIADANGRIDVTTTTGNLWVENAAGDVRVVTINGRTNIRCAKGRVEVSDTSGVITLTGVAGDVDVMTSGGRASFTGSLRAGGHYRLRTLSGSVQALLPEDASNFTATLSSYSGHIETDFSVQSDMDTLSGTKPRRAVSKVGGGQIQIELDAFNGRVRLSRVSQAAIEKCER